ncbi:MAG TPA: hypothetical protein VFA32_04855 [Dehalococcoidia bacterium]|nr:hypothetical protein [Dehalococcoidia bacterium]
MTLPGTDSQSGLAYADICEIVECRVSYANQCLDAGYILLYVGHVAQLDSRPAGQGNEATSYVRRSIVYVLGRPRGVAHIQPVKRQSD